MVGLVTDQMHIWRGKQPSDLFGDRPEQLPSRYPSCHQCRDPPQCRLFLGQPRDSRTTQRRLIRSRAGAKLHGPTSPPHTTTSASPNALTRIGHRRRQQRRHVRAHRLASLPVPHRWVDPLSSVAFGRLRQAWSDCGLFAAAQRHVASRPAMTSPSCNAAWRRRRVINQPFGLMQCHPSLSDDPMHAHTTHH
jgi:hypothetical protein